VGCVYEACRPATGFLRVGVSSFNSMLSRTPASSIRNTSNRSKASGAAIYSISVRAARA
jgi:hypothetical protein